MFMKVNLFIAVLAACAQSSGHRTSPVTLQKPAESLIFDSLDTALRESRSSTQAEIVLGPDKNTLVDAFSVANELNITGAGEAVVFYASLFVEDTAVLTMSNFSIEVGRNDLQALIDVRGLVHLSSVRISLAGTSIFHLGAGQLDVSYCEVTDSKAELVTVECQKCALSLTNVVTTRHCGRLVNVPQSQSTRQLKITVSNSIFRNCTGSDWLSLFQVFKGASEPLFDCFSVVTNCSFEFNVISLFDFDSLSSSTVQISTCTFLRNSGKTLLLNARQSVVSFEACLWDSNSEVIAQVGWLGGRLAILNSQVLHQKARGIVFHSAGNIDDCEIDLTDILIYGSSNSTAYSTTGIVLSASCTVVAKRVQAIDFLPKSYSTKILRALFDVSFGVLNIEDLSVIRSGTSGYILIAINSQMFIKNAFFRLPYLGGNAVMGGVGGSTYARNITLSGSLKQEKSLDTDFDGLVFVGWFDMKVDIADMAIDNFTSNGAVRHDRSMAAAVVGTGGTFQIKRVSVQDLTIDQFIVLITSAGSISDLVFKNCPLRLSVFGLFRDSKMVLSNIAISTISTSEPLTMRGNTYSHNGVFLVGAGCSLHVANLSLSDAHLDMIFISSQATVFIETMTVERSEIGMLVRNCVDSVISMIDANFSALRTGKVLAKGSTVSFFNCSFTYVSVSDTLFYVSNSKILLEGVSLLEVYADSQLGNFAEGATVAFSHCSLKSFGSVQGGGFVIKPDGALSVHHCEFHDFNCTVFQVSGSAVDIIDCSARNGRNTIRSAKSNDAYGAFLGCLECTRVTARQMSAFNLSALRGGVLACRSEAESTQVSIAKSQFTLCSAEAGGAAYFSGCSFSILDSDFAYNRATASGGGVDLAVSSRSTRILEDCRFTGNSAVDGGAVRWHDAEVHLLNVSFARNVADYGPDLASYPVAISSAPTRAVPGHPILLVFQIVDHYGQCVSTASGKAFRLNDTDAVKYLGNQVAFADKGVITFPKLTVYAQPASMQTLSGEINEYFESTKRRLIGSVDVSFRNCTLGEVYRPTMCEYCNSGNVTYSVDDENCISCPANAWCYGGSNLTVSRRYWRSAWNSTRILECPLPDKCLGGPNSTCAEAFTGKLCTQCEEGTYRVRVTECAHCSHKALLVLQMAAIYVVLLLFSHAVLKYGLDQPDEFKLFVIKCIANHFQLLSALAPFKVTYPTVVKNALRGVAYLSSLGVSELPIACFGFAHPELLRPVVGSLVLPLLVGASAPIVLSHSKHRLKAAAVLASSLGLFVPAVVVQSVVLLLSCQSVDDDVQWLFVDMSERCWVGQHSMLVTNLLIPSILCNCLLPLFAATAVRLCRPSAFQSLFPMWWAGHKMTLWDISYTCAKCACLWLMLNSISNEKVGQVSYGLISLIVLCVTTVTLHKVIYKAKKCFFLVETSAVIVSLSLGFGSYYIYYVPGERFLDYFNIASLLSLNAMYVAVCLWLLRGPGSTLINDEMRDVELRICSTPFPTPQNSLSQPV